MDLQTWDAWHTVHQPFELKWWKKALANGHSQDPVFDEMWTPVRDFVQPTGVIIDIGCGPRPPFAPCYVIEPLAIAYQSITPLQWWDGVIVYAHPAEHLAPGLLADTIICWNCLDHAIGWRTILDNMVSYGNPGARFAVATDFHPAFTGHPGFSREDFDREIDQRFTVIEKREPFGRHLALLMKAK